MLVKREYGSIKSPDEESLHMLPCSAGHTACYVSPYGDMYPYVQFPLPSGNVRRMKFVDIWHDSPQLKEIPRAPKCRAAERARLGEQPTVRTNLSPLKPPEQSGVHSSLPRNLQLSATIPACVAGISCCSLPPAWVGC